MTALLFSDGMSFDTSGPLRIECRSDGFYVVGGGMLCAVADRAEGMRMIEDECRARVAARLPASPVVFVSLSCEHVRTYLPKRPEDAKPGRRTYCPTCGALQTITGPALKREAP